MSKISAPKSLSSAFNIDPNLLKNLGVVDVQLDTDTRLFIDPLLLYQSQHEEMHRDATKNYEDRFNQVLKLLAVSKMRNDVAWRGARKLFNFSEVSNTCLGYSSSVRGSGFGPELVEQTLETAKEIVDLGVNDPDLFMALALFEEGIGPDRISDMTTNIILENLVDFTHRVNKTLNLPVSTYKIKNKDRKLIVNPETKGGILLVPTDIVRALPFAVDWSDIGRVVRENEEFRDRLNDMVGGIWSSMSKKEKLTLRNNALNSKDAFNLILELIQISEPTPYDFVKDKEGELFWMSLLSSISNNYPKDLSQYSGRTLGLDEADKVVKEILLQFQDLVENKGLWKELWSEEDKPRKEKAAQRLLFAVAYSYCKANNIDITPEADAGNGPVDFKFSQGFNSRIVVEIKLSTNKNVVHGYEKQLEIYKKAEDTKKGYFLLIDVGSIGNKYADVQRIRDDFKAKNGCASEIIYVDGNQKASASVRS